MVFLISEKERSDLLLQIPQGLSERLPGDKESLGGPGVVQGLGGFEKIAQLGDVQNERPSLG